MADLERLHSIDLVPVVELEAWAFSVRSTPETNGPTAEHRAAWHDYWVACLADAGITDLAPIRYRSMHVRAAALAAHPALLAVLARLVPPEDRSEPDEVGPLGGGIALLGNGRLVQEPMCCSDLSHWRDWRAVAGYRGTDWRMLWIGHPWLSARGTGDDLELSRPHEGGPAEPAWVLNRDHIPQAVTQAVAELEQLAERVAAELGGRHARALSRRLCGLPPVDDPDEDEPGAHD